MRTQQTQAARSLVLCCLGWALFLMTLWMFWTMRQGQGTRDMFIVTMSLFLLSFVPAFFGLGQAAANIRSRGRRLTLATWCLVLTSLQVGLTLSVIVLNVTHN